MTLKIRVEKRRNSATAFLKEWKIASRSDKKAMISTLSRYRAPLTAMVVHCALMEKDVQSASEIAEYVALERWREE